MVKLHGVVHNQLRNPSKSEKSEKCEYSINREENREENREMGKNPRPAEGVSLAQCLVISQSTVRQNRVKIREVIIRE